MVRDMAQRVTLARVDDNQRRGTIVSARRLIYERNFSVNSASVEKLLKPLSLVPTLVCYACHWPFTMFNLKICSLAECLL